MGTTGRGYRPGERPPAGLPGNGSPTNPWITSYLFPGGELPQLYDICQLAGQYDLCITDIENLHCHYHLTLEHWIKPLERRLDHIRKLIGNNPEETEHFLRWWRLYLNGSPVNFFHDPLDLYQLTFTRGLTNELPLIRSMSIPELSDQRLVPYS